MTRRVTAVLAVCLLAAAACSSDDGDAGPTTSTPVAAPDDTVATGADGPSTDDPADGSPAGDAPGGDGATPATDPAGPSSPPPSTPSTAPVTTIPSAAADDGIAAPQGDEPTVLGPLGSTEVELDTGDGTVQIGVGAVPDLIPAAFPRPDDLVVQIASDTEDTAGFSGVSQLGFDVLVQLYRDGLDAAGYEVVDAASNPGSLAVLGFDGPDGVGEVVISSPAPGGGTSVIVTFER